MRALNPLDSLIGAPPGNWTIKTIQRFIDAARNNAKNDVTD